MAEQAPSSLAYEEESLDNETLVEDHSDSSPQDMFFDRVVCALQQIVLHPAFQSMQRGFISKHVDAFSRGDESSVQCMAIYQQYQTLMEKYLEQERNPRNLTIHYSTLTLLGKNSSTLQMLKKSVPNFEMDEFLPLLAVRPDRIDEELLDMLHSLTDFLAFKNIVIDFKEQQSINLGDFGFSVKPLRKK